MKSTRKLSLEQLESRNCPSALSMATVVSSARAPSHAEAVQFQEQQQHDQIEIANEQTENQEHLLQEQADMTQEQADQQEHQQAESDQEQSAPEVEQSHDQTGAGQPATESQADSQAVQVQANTQRDVRHASAMNQQGAMRAIDLRNQAIAILQPVDRQAKLMQPAIDASTVHSELLAHVEQAASETTPQAGPFQQQQNKDEPVLVDHQIVNDQMNDGQSPLDASSSTA